MDTTSLPEIITATAAEPVELASSELAEYLAALTGNNPPEPTELEAEPSRHQLVVGISETSRPRTCRR